MALLQITKQLSITPLIEIQSTAFAKQYTSGVRWRLFGWQEHGEIQAQGPLPDHYLIENLIMCAHINDFDGYHQESLQKDIGFCLGMLHGGVLTPEGMCRSQVTTLVIIHNRDFRSGYERGRRNYFTQYDSISHTDQDLMDLWKAHAEENLYWGPKKCQLQWVIGCTVGELSGRLFSLTGQEQAAWASFLQKQEKVQII